MSVVVVEREVGGAAEKNCKHACPAPFLDTSPEARTERTAGLDKEGSQDRVAVQGEGPVPRPDPEPVQRAAKSSPLAWTRGSRGKELAGVAGWALSARGTLPMGSLQPQGGAR